MNESGDQQQRMGSSVNPKIFSDSGYGSNKSTQRSSGSSKSHESSISSESSTAYPHHPNAPVSKSECQSHTALSPTQAVSGKRQGKKKKNDRRQSVDGNQPMDQGTGGQAPSNLAAGGSQHSQIMSPGSKTSSTHDSKALQMAALTHALSCMKKFQKTDSEINEESDEIGTTPVKWQEYFSTDVQMDGGSGNEDTFATVVSLEDGIIVYITPTISDILGFPKDMLVGRSFIDFVHPKDRMAFASHITCGMSFPMNEQQNQGTTNKDSTRVKSEPFYCRLRQYRGLKTVGFGVVDKSVLYYPFKLTMTLKKVEQNQSMKDETNKEKVLQQGDEAISKKSVTASGPALMNEGIDAMNGNRKQGFAGVSAQNSTVNLVIVANRIQSAYQFPDEVPASPGKFVTRHSASCHFGHMDSEAISYLGHLPQDLIGNSVLDYYHPDDMGLMKDIYEGVMQEQGKPFRSKPYRFRVYNGSFAVLETDWSCFINPWSWKLEFVIGQHRVIKGPGNPNVFEQPSDETDYLSCIPDEILDESKDIQAEIKKLLTETVTRHISDPLRQQSSRRRKDLAALMESLLEGMVKPENSDKSGSQCSGMFSATERDSVMLGEISPHHDHDQSGSNQSSETPPSYNQLNYRENIERFFQSQPKTVRSDEPGESPKLMETNQSPNRSSDSDSKSSPNLDSSSGSNIGLSSGSNENENESGGDRDCASPLTEERLSRHNEAMEKYMIQRHRELRGKSSMTSHKENRHKPSEKVFIPFQVASSTCPSNDNDKCSYYRKLARCQRRNKCKLRATGGVKRTGNASWEGDTHTAKQPHLECQPRNNFGLAHPATSINPCCAGHGHHNTINLWPPFSITTTPGVCTSTYRSPGISGNFNCFNPSNREANSVPESMPASASAPMFFLPTSHHQQFVPRQVQLFPTGVVYQPMGSCVYGQPPGIMMPAGILGTMNPFNPGQMNQMGTNIQVSQGEVGRTATLPSDKRKEGSSKLNQKGSDGNQINHLKPNILGIEGSSSEESMNNSSTDTKDSLDFYKEESQPSDQDLSNWSNERQVGNGRARPLRNKQPPWLEQVNVTPDLMYRYKLPAGDLSDILQKDLEALKIFGKQSTMVNDQLGMLYSELNFDGSGGIALNLEEGFTSNSSSGDENGKDGERKKAKKPVTSHQYRRMVIMYEENSPFPPEVPKTKTKTEAAA